MYFVSGDIKHSVERFQHQFHQAHRKSRNCICTSVLYGCMPWAMPAVRHRVGAFCNGQEHSARALSILMHVDHYTWFCKRISHFHSEFNVLFVCVCREFGTYRTCFGFCLSDRIWFSSLFISIWMTRRILCGPLCNWAVFRYIKSIHIQINTAKKMDKHSRMLWMKRYPRLSRP